MHNIFEQNLNPEIIWLASFIFILPFFSLALSLDKVVLVIIQATVGDQEAMAMAVLVTIQAMEAIMEVVDQITMATMEGLGTTLVAQIKIAFERTTGRSVNL